MSSMPEREKYEPKQDQEDKLFEEFFEKYSVAVITAEELEKIVLIPRPKLMGEWFREGDLGFIFGERGNGKTWMTEAIAVSLSMGRDLGSWTVPGKTKVLYLDGEMAQEETQARIIGMARGNRNLHILHHERLFDTSSLSINLGQEMTQRAITRLCIERNVKVLILDNLSCLVSGVKENEGDAWEILLNWLLDLRRRRIAVLIVVHAGRNGLMRGTSRREDAAAWIIRVELAEVDNEQEKGARFQSEFTKNRSSQTPEFSQNWTFITDTDTKNVQITCQKLSFDDKVYQCICHDPPIGCEEISKVLKCSKASVSRSARRLVSHGKIEIKKRKYAPVHGGTYSASNDP
jgi:AAA domain